MKKVKRFILLALGVFISACNATRSVVPLQKNEHKIDVGFGGPGIIQFGAPMPMPLSSVNYNYGISDNYTLRASLHTTAALFGVLQTDLGFTSYVYKNTEKQWGITYSPTLNLMTNFWNGESRIYPQLDCNYYSIFKNKHLVYGSLSSWFALMKEKAHNEPQTQRFLPSFAIGYTKLNDKWQWSIEAKYLAPFNSSKDLVVDYISPGNRGAIGVYFTLSRKLIFKNNE